MSSGQSFSRSLMKLPLSVLVKGTSIPSNPVEDLNIDLGKPIVYALPFRSSVDLLTLQKHALELGLPDPLSKLEIFTVKALHYTTHCLGEAMQIRGCRSKRQTLRFIFHAQSFASNANICNVEERI